ncbi:MAG: NAD(P)/FAD-dependent oxidoreductase [Rhodanobacteraceae bacterium]
MDDADASFDCAVIGAGPAGLTGALYLARFRRRVVVFDGGNSRARWIPESHNCPGFPGGISGVTLLQRLCAQLSAYEVAVRRTLVETARLADGAFELRDADGHTVRARTLLLATGIVDSLPDVDWAEAAINVGALRLCPVCDGYEASDQRIAVYGPAATALDHAIFLRTFSSNVTLVCSDATPLAADAAEQAATLGVRVIEHAHGIAFDGQRCSFAVDAARETFDTVYAFLGCQTQSALARSLGAKTDELGALEVDRHQMTSVDGLYAAGDVVSSLNQISVAVGHAGVAATAIHHVLGHSLRERARNPRELAR